MAKHPSATPQVQPAKVSWDENHQPISKQFNDFYYSKVNGLEEAEYVFFKHNQLLQRWQQPLSSAHFIIAETGFGAGLNFLLAWQQWLKLQPKTCNNQTARLHFISVEKHPLIRSDLIRALALWPQLSEFSNALIAQYPPQPANGCSRIVFDNGAVTLTLFFGEATEGLSQFAPCSTLNRSAGNAYRFAPTSFAVDAWFLDGFSPAKNPEMWTPELFNNIKLLSAENTTFATFTAASSVRRGLTEVGFECKKATGFGGKREMLWGNFVGGGNQEDSSEKSKKRDAAHHYWHLHAGESPTLATTQKPVQTALVIGGGLAGCQTAFALAQRGIKVTLLEKNAKLAEEASGNRQGVVYTRLSPHFDKLSLFNFAAQVHANHFYSRASEGKSLFERCGEACGVVHLATQEKQLNYYQQLAERYTADSAFCRWLSAEEVSALSGLKVKLPGLFLPQAGWLSPVKLCDVLCTNPLIEPEVNSHVQKLIQNSGTWQAYDGAGTLIGEADCAIITNAHCARLFEQSAGIPLKTIRGQVTHLENAAPLSPLKTVLCGEGYVSPALNNVHCAGASFNLQSDSTNIDPKDHEQNIANLQQMVELAESFKSVSTISGRVGFRTTTPDYFPVAGPVPMLAPMEQAFARLRHNANAVLSEPGLFYPNLYIHTGLGSRGLAYSPLCAEQIASLICGEPLAIDQELYRHLHPARFLIRNLMRNKPSTL